VRVGSKFWRRFWAGIASAIAFCLSVSNVSGMPGISHPSPEIFPLQAHPLPATLAQWQDPDSQGDYFSEVQTTPAGYLVWSNFPVKIYIEVPSPPTNTSVAWVNAASDAIEAWGAYLPLQTVDRPENADITIARRRPPPERSANGSFRARSALTRYEFYTRQGENNAEILAHRFEIAISPTQTGDYVRTAILHELGHAIGIWGHSPVETDALYFSQVRQPQGISVRDVNTLKRVYEQPTRLGWISNK